jgi:hypothetical protein
MERPVCTNGNRLDEYPTQRRQATRIGINFRGWVEYANVKDGVVYEAVYPVHETEYFAELRQHDMLGETIDEHVERSEEIFDEWKHAEIQ